MKPGVKLRRRLFLLAAAAIVPLAIMSGVGFLALKQQQYAQAERAALEISRALMTGVDAELGRSIAVLQAMTASPLVDEKNFLAYYRLAQRVVHTRTHWLGVTLATPSGELLLNTRFAYGTRLPPVVETETFGRVVTTAEPVVGYVTRGPEGKVAFAVRVPVIRDNKLQYVLTAIVKPESILEVVRRQRLPDDWVVSVFDAKGIRVARSRQHEAFINQPPAPSLQRLMDQGNVEGTGVTYALEGQKIFSAYTRSTQTGWTVAIGIAPEFIEAGTWSSLAALGSGILLSILLAILATLAIARSINRPIGALTTAAQALGRGDTPSPPVTGIQEIRDVADAIIAASNERARNEAEREQLLSREQQARAAAEAANRAKDEFLAMLSHELRNPLGAIANATRLLEHPRVGADTARHARAIIARQTELLAHMTDDLLDAARAVTGKITLHRQPLDLAAAAATALATFRLHAEKHDIVQQLEPVWVDADSTRLEQMISNLLSNAVKYTATGGTIRVTVQKEGTDAVLRVADNGIGMSPDLMARAFELFVQGRRELDRLHGGLGIGLTLVRRLAELHGGSAEAKSAGPDQGSEIIVRLPSIPAIAAEPTPPAAPPQPIPRDILVIEDNDDARESMRQLLEMSGHRVRTAADGAAGLEAALAAPPDIALVDVGLPTLDGYQVARRIRAAHDGNGPPLVLVALTGYGLPEDRKRALEAGFDLHFVKPIDEAALEELLCGTVVTQRR